MSEEVEFEDEYGSLSVWYEDDQPPFDTKCMGYLIKDSEGYFRFFPSKGVVMTQKHFRVVGAKISDLNIKG